MASAQEILVASHNSNFEAIFLELNFEKAFDSVSWDFFFELLVARGFVQGWIGRIKACLLSGTSSILVNGKPVITFNVRRALDKGILSHLSLHSYCRYSHKNSFLSRW